MSHHSSSRRLVASAARIRWNNNPQTFAFPTPVAVRWMTTLPPSDISVAPPPEVHPLDLFRQESQLRQCCDSDGYRLKGSHWAFSIAVSPPPTEGEDSPNKFPNLRTIGFQRVSPYGVDFLLKRGSPSDWMVQRPVSLLYMEGKYRPGETVEQWRMEGTCQPLDVLELLQRIGKPVIVGMIASQRMQTENATAAATISKTTAATAENEPGVSPNRQWMTNPSHFVDVVQKTREQVEQNVISNEEIVQSLQAVRLIPHRIERMVGGPDYVMWNRWEWIRRRQEGTRLFYGEPQQILPY